MRIPAKSTAVRLLGLLSAVVVATTAAVAPASAATYPPQTFSRYVASTNMYTMGCNQGKASDAQGQHTQLALLSFGDAGWDSSNTFGAYDNYIGGFNSISTIEANVKNYMQGFYDCTVSGSKSFMNVAPGVTNNGSGFNSANDYALGQAWGRMVVDLGAWIASKGYGTQLAALGSADLEPGFGPAGHAINWANGFQSTGAYYYDFGSADGCNSAGCNNGWTLANEYQLAWGNVHADAAPEIYNAAMAAEWKLISDWGKANTSSGAIYFSAAVSQYQACLDLNAACSGTNFTPAQSWQAILSATGQAPPFATEMSYQSV
jgi:hypothetical protein